MYIWKGTGIILVNLVLCVVRPMQASC